MIGPELRVPEPPERLVSEFRAPQRRVVLLVGSGISMGVKRNDGRNFPSWVQLIQEVLQRARDDRHRFTEREQRALEKLLDSRSAQSYLLAAGWLRKKIGPAFFREYLGEALETPVPLRSRVHDVLHALPTRGIITFNYDKLLEASWPGSGPSLVATSSDTGALTRIVRGDVAGFLLKCHGTLDQADTVILGHDDYRRVIHQNPAYRDTLATLFSQSTILALGCGVDDPDLEMLFDDLLTTFPALPLRMAQPFVRPSAQTKPSPSNMNTLSMA